MIESHSRRARKGQSLLLVMFLLIVLAGIMALTLDFGFVLQSRRLMQTGVNTAALEGLRNLDTDGDGFGDGRQNSAGLLRNVFDDDLDPTQNLTTVGAGIDSSLVQGNGFRQTILGNGNGSQSLHANRSDFIFRPDPQFNTMDSPSGDMAVGDYHDGESDHREFSNYERVDFNYGANETAFLVRMRRTHDPDGLDQIAGVSSGSGGLPLLMGRLAWFSVQPADAGYSIRRDGVTVRATAIADKQPVVRVWQTNNSQIFSAIQFGVSKSDYLAHDLATLTDQTVPPIDEVILPTTPVVGTGLGERVSLNETPSDAEKYDGQVGYIAIIDQFEVESKDDPPQTEVVNLVIGFHLIGFDPNAVVTGATSQPIANASSRIQDAWETLSCLTQDEREELYDSCKDAIDDSTNQLLMTGALVRTIR